VDPHREANGEMEKGSMAKEKGCEMKKREGEGPGKGRKRRERRGREVRWK